jgi:hypothetical protein
MQLLAVIIYAAGAEQKDSWSLRSLGMRIVVISTAGRNLSLCEALSLVHEQCGLSKPPTTDTIEKAN